MQILKKNYVFDIHRKDSITFFQKQANGLFSIVETTSVILFHPHWIPIHTKLKTLHPH